MKISVVISVYNEEAMIAGCLESLLAQSRLADEVLLVDNNCSDKTIEIAHNYPVKIICEPRQGIWAARATGYDASSGDIIVCTDADARFPSNWLISIEEALSKEDIVAVCGPGRFYDGSWLANRAAGLLYMKPYFWLVGSALATKPLFGSNFAMRAACWRKVRSEVHSHSESVFDDIDLSYHVTKHGRIAYSSKLYNYISIRPLRQPWKMLKRYPKGLRSITIHWPQQSPPVLYRRRLRR